MEQTSESDTGERATSQSKQTCDNIGIISSHNCDLSIIVISEIALFDSYMSMSYNNSLQRIELELLTSYRCIQKIVIIIFVFHFIHNLVILVEFAQNRIYFNFNVQQFHMLFPFIAAHDF